MTPEEQRDEESLIIQRVQAAHDRRTAAVFALSRQFIPHGSGVLNQKSLDELDSADAEFKAARADMDRIVDEIRSGKRR